MEVKHSLSLEVVVMRCRIPDFSNHLRDYLSKNYPEKLSDSNFIEERNIEAQRTFAMSILRDYDEMAAKERAVETLLYGFVFSKYHFIIDNLTQINSRLVPNIEFEEAALDMLSDCEAIFYKYDLTTILTDDAALQAMREEFVCFIERNHRELIQK